jgi:uronate dehydrogenase
LLSNEDLVVVTGAEGMIGQAFRMEYFRSYEETYRLRLAVLEQGFSDDRCADIARFDLTDAPSIDEAVRGARAILHLAAEPRHDANMKDLIGPNIVGAFNLFESARRAGCERIVFASSAHAVLGMAPDYQAHAQEASRADCLYGATKVFGEALCSAYAHQHGMSCIAVRIGAFVPAADIERWVVTDRAYLSMGITERDLCHLLHQCLVAPTSLRFAVVHGVSDNRYKLMEVDTARTLVEYRPRDDLFQVAEDARRGQE